MKKWEKFTDEQLKQFVKDSKSVRELAEKIGYNPDSGSGATSIKNMLELKHFDTSHFLGQNWNKNNFDYSLPNLFKSVENIVYGHVAIKNHIEYIKDAFLISEAKRYDIKGRKYIGSNSKYYFTDIGLRNALINFRID